MRKWLFILPALLLIAIGMIAWNTGRVGESSVEAWVGSELKSIVAAKGRFELDFTSIDYQAPNRVVLEGARFSLSDAQNGAMSLVEVQRGTIDLAEVPRYGTPIVIEHIELEQPIVRVDAFLEAAKRNRKDADTSTQKSLSSVLTLKQVGIVDGQITYDDGKGSPLTWSELNARLTLEPTSEQWHRVRLEVKQAPLMSALVAAEIDLDAMSIRAIDLKATADLNDPAARRFFTPPMQRWIEKHEITGRVDAVATGTFSLRDREANSIDATLDLKSGHFTIGDYHLPIDALSLQTTLRGQTMTIRQADTPMLGGTVRGEATVTLDDDRRLAAQFVAQQVRLEQLLRTRDDNDKSELAGEMNALVAIESMMPTLRSIFRDKSEQKNWGNGSVSIRKGRLVKLPVISHVIAATRKATSALGLSEATNDAFDAQFQLVDRTASIHEMIYRGDVIGMRGKGRVGFDGMLDLSVNAGPLERLQQTLGPIGSLWGKISDHVMSYRVKGTLKSPDVSLGVGPG